MEQSCELNTSSLVQDENILNKQFAIFKNCQGIAVSSVPLISEQEFKDTITQTFKNGYAVSALYAVSNNENKKTVFAVLSNSATSELYCCKCELKTTVWESLVNQVPAVHLFEREMAEQQNITLNGHPWPKPVRYGSKDELGNKSSMPKNGEFYRVEGDEIHEVAVGPVHAGIIEPGHFRFQCHGENVLHLEIALGYQHRGIESKLTGGPNVKTLHYIENIAGDTTIANTVAYCQAIESLSGCKVSPRAEALRGIALELERLANHTGDLGALAQDIGFLPVSSYCGRLRGDFLNLTALLCGSRFGRGFVCPGGVQYDLDNQRAEQFTKKFLATIKDVKNAVSLLWNKPSVLGRFEGTGKITLKTATELGMVGMAARACGMTRDARHDFPYGIYKDCQLPVSTYNTGDVFARAYLRWMEIQHSSNFILDLLKALPQGEFKTKTETLLPEQFIVSIVEGWRGEVCHVAETDKNGTFKYYKVIDPSFHNWTGLAIALRNQPISDFPVCNKSFNLSYCGHDL